VAYCHEFGIVIQAFSPLGRGEKLSDPVVMGIAEKLGKSPAQVLIRYCLQKGWVPLPKSERESRIKENAEVFDFVISDDEMASLDALDGQK
jgi:diketogulonate reductase-like aldo/keto reductase